MDYKNTVIAYLKAKARKLVKDEKASVSHIHPRAYCIAKPAAYCAVFMVPTCDRESQVSESECDVVNNASCADVKMGDWCSVAYVMT